MSTLSEVLKDHGLTENDLNKPCSHNVRRSIAMKLDNWEFLAHFLGLSEGDRADIKDKKGYQLQCLECLERWHKNCGSKATYLELVKCLLEIKHRDLAEELCKLYKNDIATKSDGVYQDAKAVSAIKECESQTPSLSPSTPTLTMKDHFNITEFLNDLNIEHLINIGCGLGLHYPKLKRMKSLPEDMIAAWLREEDNVTMTSGPPSWMSLVTALEAVGQRGIASKIKRVHLSHC